MILITSGCSFSDPEFNAWPVHLSNYCDLFTDHIGLGLCSQGNGLISRKVLYTVHEQLKINNPKNLFVGIMWSGHSRGDIYIDKKISFDKNIDGWTTNPVKFIDQDPGSWIITNHHWKNVYAKRFYKNYDTIYGQMQTLEHIIRLQNYLKLKQIKYFMTTYTSNVLEYQEHPALSWLYEQIDFEQFLPIAENGCYEWWAANTDIKMTRDNHPTVEQQKIFTKKVIVPWIKKKYNL